MEITEAKEILPFYVNGTLDPSQSEKIEELLKDNAELREQLRFWQSASDAVKKESTYARAGHLTSEQIVDYTQRRISDAATRVFLEGHIHRCNQCRDEIELVRATLPDAVSKPKTKTIVESLVELAARYKLTYLVPAFAATIFAILFLNRNHDTMPRGRVDTTSVKEEKQSGLPEIIQQVVPVERTASLVLEYTTQVRGRQQPSSRLPMLRLDSAVTSVKLALLIPHNEIPGTKYAVALRLFGGKLISSAKTNDVKKGRQRDTLLLTLPSDLFEMRVRKFEIVINELLPDKFSDLSPEEYRFAFSAGKRDILPGVFASRPQFHFVLFCSLVGCQSFASNSSIRKVFPAFLPIRCSFNASDE